MLDAALHPVVLATGLRRGDRIVVGRPRLEIVHAHAENGMGMARVQPNGRFRCLAKVLGIRTVTHNSVMLGCAAGIVVHVTIAKAGSTRSISGPRVIRTRPAFFVVGLTCAVTGSEYSRLPTATVSATF